MDDGLQTIYWSSKVDHTGFTGEGREEGSCGDGEHRKGKAFAHRSEERTVGETITNAMET